MQSTRGNRAVVAWQAIREKFGKYARHKLAKLTLESGKEAKAVDLVDGITVSCHYSYSDGNGGYFGRRRGFGGFGYGGRQGMTASRLSMLLGGYDF